MDQPGPVPGRAASRSQVNEATALGKFASSITEVGGIEPTDSPAAVVERVMRALRKPNEPYPLHGAEVAIRYCSPTNRASQLSPAAFSQYLMEPWCAAPALLSLRAPAVLPPCSRRAPAVLPPRGGCPRPAPWLAWAPRAAATAM